MKIRFTILLMILCVAGVFLSLEDKFTPIYQNGASFINVARPIHRRDSDWRYTHFISGVVFLVLVMIHGINHKRFKKERKENERT